MEQKQEKENRRWIEEYGGAVLGGGVWVLLGLIVLLGLFFKRHATTENGKSHDPAQSGRLGNTKL